MTTPIETTIKAEQSGIMTLFFDVPVEQSSGRNQRSRQIYSEPHLDINE